MTKKPIPLPKVDSSMFSHAAYDPGTRQITLIFKDSGDKYVVDDVSHERGTAFEGAASMGRYFNSQIKNFHVVRKVMD